MMHRRALGLSLAMSVICLAFATGAAAKKPAAAQVATAPATRPAKPLVRRTAPVEVSWGGSWWKAEVLERRGQLTKIHYTGWGPEWDEWVEPARIRAAAPETPLAKGRTGQRVSIEWHGSWWDGEIVATKNGFYKVHYTGWGAEWDEWVESDRLRGLGATAAKPKPDASKPALLTGR